MEDSFYYTLLFQWGKHFHSLDKSFRGMIEKVDVLNLPDSWSGSSKDQHHVLLLKKIVIEYLQSSQRIT